MSGYLSPKVAAERMDQFADLLAEGLNTTEIRKRMGLNNNQAQSILLKMRRKLGPQAV